jgi:hypothetical protein
MNLTANDLGTLITLSAAAAGSIIVILVNCITNSRCSDISIAWGCFHCIREVPPPPEPEPEQVRAGAPGVGDGAPAGAPDVEAPQLVP